MSMYASILAGGSGTRLWPLSTKALPKQFLSLINEFTMLQETVARLAPLASIEHTYVVTFENYREIVQTQLPALAADHILAEPLGRGTAASIGLAATFIAAHDPQGIMGSFSSDHVITDVDGFRRALAFAETVAREGHIVALGIQPTYAETGYGYIQSGAPLSEDDSGLTAYRVQRFVEKPALPIAEGFLAEGGYSWNAGIFVCRVDRILAEIRQHVPAVSHVLDHIARGIQEGRAVAAMQEAWPTLQENVTIDHGVLEHARDIVVIPVEIGWNDIGNWAQLATLHAVDAGHNSAQLHHPTGRHIAIDTTDTFVYSTSGRIIATAGVEGLVIVDTGDALLICRKDQVQLVKKITDALAESP